MSSINTNSSAMVALQTLRGINSSLEKTQSEISTGKTVNSAKDNSAIWAISKVMESDVSGFNAISDSLNTGSAMVGVAATAAETVSDLLSQIKEKVVAAQDPSADTAKLQSDADALIARIVSTVESAQFNGVNLVDGNANGFGSVSVLSALNRDSSGNVTAATIGVTAQDLSTKGAGTSSISLTDVGTSFDVSGNKATASVADAGTATIQFGGTLAAGDTVSVDINGTTVSYTLTTEDVASSTDADDYAVLATALMSKINEAGITGFTATYDSTASANLTFSNDTGADVSIAVSTKAASTGLGGLTDSSGTSTFDITGATALADIEGMIDYAIDAAASFGSAQSQIDGQAGFIADLTDAMKEGIGALVDADMEEASARLQALQTQQQLGIQALSIANQQPQNILSLFK